MTEDDLDEIGYADAIGELDSILARLDADDVDVDDLAALVSRATDLITVCRGRIAAAEMQVNEIVAADAGVDDDGDGDGDGDATGDTPADG